ncbi:hypothetical protein FA13DRAFT_990980 [Coprinellus micaceus]|uniref:Uncharacterized protein n=1 Tax=Coprinellus micaceus TaxID=71717 RepID=A0A4Y7RRN3_COPMI|nr:hypothetical protein FA13DRAFT_990980 [Coprinellus micaceus]
MPPIRPPKRVGTRAATRPPPFNSTQKPKKLEWSCGSEKVAWTWSDDDNRLRTSITVKSASMINAMMRDGGREENLDSSTQKTLTWNRWRRTNPILHSHRIPFSSRRDR